MPIGLLLHAQEVKQPVRHSVIDLCWAGGLGAEDQDQVTVFVDIFFIFFVTFLFSAFRSVYSIFGALSSRISTAIEDAYNERVLISSVLEVSEIGLKRVLICVGEARSGCSHVAKTMA